MKMELSKKKLMRGIENTSGDMHMHMFSDLQLVYMVPRNSTQLLNINQGRMQDFSRGGPNFKISWILDIHAAKRHVASSEAAAFARGVWGHAPTRKFLKMVQFRAF